MRIIKEKILLEPKDIIPSSDKMEVLGVLNPGAIRMPDKKIVLYARVIEKLKKTHDSDYFYSPRFTGKDNYELVIDKFSRKNIKQEEANLSFDFKDGTKRLTYISHLRRVVLDETGMNVLEIDSSPSIYGTKNDSELGIEDPRIVKIKNKYYMTYVGLGVHENISTNLAVSNDCINWKKKGIIFGEQDKDVVLFSEKINGKYVAFDRPEGNFEFTPPHIWIAYSKDLRYWGKLKPIEFSRTHFNFTRSGAGPPPIKTEKGWLFIFHGVTKKFPSKFKVFIEKIFGIPPEDKDVYAVWAILFDLKNPRKIISRSVKPILVPRKNKHRSFEDKLVIFPTGAISDLDNKSLLIYSGLGDISIGVQKVLLSDLMKSLKKV